MISLKMIFAGILMMLVFVFTLHLSFKKEDIINAIKKTRQAEKFSLSLQDQATIKKVAVINTKQERTKNMKTIVSKKAALLIASIFIAALMLDSCASGPKGGTKHCTGKKTARTKAIHRMAPTMAR